ncbi:MAG: hypothetical protein Q7J54_06760 [Candidatus Woesearchaeota archaeon]|nr:hypothetical protein [Candidatus Woesearchaeota archaeon]
MVKNILNMKSLRFQKAGDRTLTNSKKRGLKAQKRYKCQKCHKKKSPTHLIIHHTDEIYKVKRRAGFMGQLGKPTFDKKIPYHDRKDKLRVLCLDCHKDVHDQLSAKKKTKKKPSIFDLGL